MAFSLKFFGTFYAGRDGVPITGFRSNKTRALLAFLALEADRPHRRETLAALLWSQHPEAAAQTNLRQTLSRLRRALDEDPTGPPLLEVTRQTLQFNLSPGVSLDTQTFSTRLRNAEQHAHSGLATCPECIGRLEEAAALYRGELLGGFSVRESGAFEEWLTVAREAFRQEALETLYNLAAVYEQQRDYGRAQTYARQQLALEPWREEAHRQLIRALALQGESSAALAQYRACRTLLAAELGVEPTAATTDLAKRIEEGAPLTATSSLTKAPPHNLLVQLTPFIGREKELEDLTKRLGDPDYRLLSLVGPGGIGKTRLALEVAAGQLERFRDGVFFIPLVGVESAEDLPAAVAQVLNIEFSAPRVPPSEQLLVALQTKELLLVLDNFEQLLTGADWVLGVLRRAPGVTLLVTSRERLNIQAEDLYLMHGLPVPAEDDAAAGDVASVRLFLDRARRLDKQFRLGPGTLPEVVRTCRAVEGLPLAIELAVTWIQEMSLREIADATLRDLDFLATDLRDVAPHQRSLRRVFERSWAGLGADEREVFVRLSVFRGGFGARAAAAVAGASALSLTRLRYKSLVRASGPGRYSVHELLRQFAAEKSAAYSDLQESHSDYYLSALAERSEALQGVAPKVAAQALQPDLDNLRQAWRWAVAQGRLPTLEQSVSAFEHMYTLMGLDAEGEQVFSAAAQRFEPVSGDDARRFRARVLMELCRCQRVQGKLEVSISTAQEAVRLARAVGARYVEAKALLAWGHSRLSLGDPDAATRLLSEGLVSARAGEYAVVEAELLINLGFVHDVQGDSAAFERCLQEALVILRRISNRSLEQAALLYLSLCEFQRGDYGVSRKTVEQALRLSDDTGFTFYEASIVDLYGRIEQALGLFEHALSLHERSLELSRDVGYRNQENHALHHLCAAHRKLGALGRAEAFGREALVVAEDLALPEPLSWTHMNLGYVFLAQGRWLEAQDAFTRAQDGWKILGDKALEMQARAGLAEAFLAREQVAGASELAETIAGFLGTNGSRRMDESARVYLTCYRVFAAQSDPRAAVVLEEAYALMEARAQGVTDPALRRSYLAVAENRELAELWTAAQNGLGTPDDAAP